MKIATSPFVYWGVAVFMPEKLGNLQRDFLEVPQFSQVLPPLPDTPRGISETPMVMVPATASLLRAFQPRSSDSFHSVYSGLRPIYAAQPHPKTPLPTHIQSLRGAKLRSGNAPAPKASGWPRAKPEPRSGRKGTRESPNAQLQTGSGFSLNAK